MTSFRPRNRGPRARTPPSHARRGPQGGRLPRYDPQTRRRLAAGGGTGAHHRRGRAAAARGVPAGGRHARLRRGGRAVRDVGRRVVGGVSRRVLPRPDVRRVEPQRQRRARGGLQLDRRRRQRDDGAERQRAVRRGARDPAHRQPVGAARAVWRRRVRALSAHTRGHALRARGRHVVCALPGAVLRGRQVPRLGVLARQRALVRDDRVAWRRLRRGVGHQRVRGEERASAGAAPWRVPRSSLAAEHTPPQPPAPPITTTTLRLAAPS